MGEGRSDARDAVPSPASFGRAFRAILEESVRGRVEQDPPFVARLAEHFGEDPRGLPILSERLSRIEHPNVQAAFEASSRGSRSPTFRRTSCRRRLLERYGAGLDLRVEDSDSVVARTEGVSASFIKELLRRSALRAAEELHLETVAERARRSLRDNPALPDGERLSALASICGLTHDFGKYT